MTGNDWTRIPVNPCGRKGPRLAEGAVCMSGPCLPSVLCGTVGSLVLAFTAFLCRALGSARDESWGLLRSSLCGQTTLHIHTAFQIPRSMSRAFYSPVQHLTLQFLLLSFFGPFLLCTTAVTALGHFDAKQLPLIVFCRCPVDKAVHREGPPRQVS